jgi:hybrid cluster-associated redox disulfide protein
MEKGTVVPDMMVGDVMSRWPATLRTFLDFGMRCVGCPIAAFHSIDEACAQHDAGPGFLQALRAVAGDREGQQ